MNHDITENSALVPASSTIATVPFVPDGTGDKGSFMLISSIRVPSG